MLFNNPDILDFEWDKNVLILQWWIFFVVFCMSVYTRYIIAEMLQKSTLRMVSDRK